MAGKEKNASKEYLKVAVSVMVRERFSPSDDWAFPHQQAYHSFNLYHKEKRAGTYICKPTLATPTPGEERCDSWYFEAATSVAKSYPHRCGREGELPPNYGQPKRTE